MTIHQVALQWSPTSTFKVMHKTDSPVQMELLTAPAAGVVILRAQASQFVLFSVL